MCHYVHTAVCESLLGCPVDYRRILAQNVVLIGGMCALPGFGERLVKSVRHLLHLPVGRQLSLVPLPCPPILLPWVGGSIVGCTSGIKVGSRYARQEWEVERQSESLPAVHDWIRP